MKTKKLALAIPVIILGLPNTAYAQKVSIGVYPPLIRIRATPKATVDVPVAVINQSSAEQDLNIVLRSFQASSDNTGGIDYYTEKNLPQFESNFLKTVRVEADGKPINNLRLYPKDSKTLTLHFTAPTEIKDHYFSVIFLSLPTNQHAHSTVSMVSSGVATNVLLSLSSNTQSNGIITEFKAPGVVFNGPTPLSLVVANINPTYTTVSGKITIYDIFGNEAGQIPLKTTSILGDETRIMSAQLPQAGTDKILWGENFLLGIYTAKAVVSFDKTNTAVSETHFIGIPLAILLVVSVIFILVLNIVFRALKKLNFKEA